MKRPSRVHYCISIVVFFLSLMICLSLAPGSLFAQSVALPTYGQGKIKVRVYTDYFCVPCRAGESRIEPLLADLVKKKKITLTFIDTPVHPETPLYARYFLYITQYKKDFDYVLSARNALFDAATIKIITGDRLEEFLAGKGIKFKTFDARQTLDAMSRSILDDGVKNTPTVVIDNGSQKERFVGVDKIVSALELLK